jgi:hypothetical protein
MVSIPGAPNSYLGPEIGNADSFTYVGFEVFTAVTMKNAVFWGVAPCIEENHTTLLMIAYVRPRFEPSISGTRVQGVTAMPTRPV